jgi:hypothetical protein
MIKIDHIRTVGFKGFDIDEDVPEKSIRVGKNRVGKSTLSEAIAFVIDGHVSFSTAGKRPADILDSFGDGVMLAGVVEIKGKEFGRKISRNEKGVVSQVLQYEKKRVAADVFSSMLGKVGRPKIADHNAFMAQSEAKKVDTLFELFPDPFLSKIDEKIMGAKEDISRIEKQISGCESTISRLTTSKNEIEKPSGTIASVRDEIQTVEDQITDLEKQIKEAEIEEAKAKATADEIARREKAEEDEKQRMKDEEEEREAIKQIAVEQPLKTDEDWEQHNLSGPSNDPDLVEADRVITKMENQMQGVNSGQVVDAEFDPDLFPVLNPSESIQNIIDALKGSGCSTCAALIVAKMELKKYV